MADRLFTILVEWDGKDTREELDIEAVSEYEARRIARFKLDRDYNPNWRIVSVEQRHPEVTGWPKEGAE